MQHSLYAERIMAVRDVLRQRPGLTAAEIDARLPFRLPRQLLARMYGNGCLTRRPRHQDQPGGRAFEYFNAPPAPK